MSRAIRESRRHRAVRQAEEAAATWRTAAYWRDLAQAAWSAAERDRREAHRAYARAAGVEREQLDVFARRDLGERADLRGTGSRIGALEPLTDAERVDYQRSRWTGAHVGDQVVE